MKSSEIRKELSLSYEELAEYLIMKYGPAKVDYFCTSTCRSRNNAVSRTKEGLLCHHIDEDKGSNLSKSHSAATQPFSWQKKERLVYCNYIEHLILHIKIAILRQKAPLKTPQDINAFFTTGGIFMVCNDLNDLFDQKSSNIDWQQRCYIEIEENLCDYILLIRLLLEYVRQQYIGTKDPISCLRVGGKVQFGDGTGIITKYDEGSNKILVKPPNCEERFFPLYCFFTQFTYDDFLCYVTQMMATGYRTFYKWLYDQFMKPFTDNSASTLLSFFQLDFHGYGFPQFAYDFIDSEKYGSSSIDEYVSKAISPFTTPSYKITDVKPIFWTGKIPQRVISNHHFYIVRVRAVFKIKAGEIPFIVYKHHTPFHMSDAYFGPFPFNNLTFRDGRIVTTSFNYDKESGVLSPTYYGASGELADSELIVSMTRDDYAQFKRKYHVLKCKVLDGCYFER